MSMGQQRFTLWTSEDDYTEDDIDCVEDNYLKLQEIRDSLNALTKGINIIAIADLGLWDGRKTGYKVYRDKAGVGECIEYSQDYMECDLYILSNGELYMSGFHHDGMNIILFRGIRANKINSKKFREVCRKLYFNEEVTDEELDAVTFKLGKLAKRLVI